MSDKPVISRKRQSAIHLFFQYMGLLLVIVQGIVLAPLYLTYVSKELYGAWLATGNVLAWIQLIDPGLSRVMQQRVAHTLGSHDDRMLLRVIGTGLVLGFVLALLPLIAWPFNDDVAGLIDKLTDAERAELARAFSWALVGTALTIAAFQPSAASIGLHLITPSGLIYVIAGILGIVATVAGLLGHWGLLALPMGLIVRALAMLVGNMFLTLAWCRRFLQGMPRFSRDEMRNYASLVSITFIERLGTTMIQQLDSFLAARLIDPGSASVYSFTGKAYDPVRMSSERFGPAFLPSLSHLAGEGRMERAVEICRRLLAIVAFMVSVSAACVIALNFAFVPLWMREKGPELFGGQSLTILIGVSIALAVMVSCVCDVVFALGGIRINAGVRLVEGVLRVVLQAALAIRFGLKGLAVGACVSSLLSVSVFMPFAAARLLGQSSRELARDIGILLVRVVLTLSCGAALGAGLRGLHWDWNWPLFTGIALSTGVVLSACGLLIHVPVRAEAFAVLARIRQRFHRPPAI